MSGLTITRTRLERLVAERALTNEKIEGLLKDAEDEQRDPDQLEAEHLERYRTRARELEGEIATLAEELERVEASRDVSRLIRPAQASPQPQQASMEIAPAYRTFAQFARDELIARYPIVATRAAAGGDASLVRAQAQERLQRAVINTLTSDIAGLVPPSHMSQIMDIINRSRPVAASGRQVPLSSGTLTYPKIIQRPEVLKQTTEKTLAGTANMQVELNTLTAETYLGAGDLSWQAISWSNPDALQLWFDLAAELYARATETAACAEVVAAGGGTSTPKLGTAGTEDFAGWRAAILAGIASIYSGTGGRAQTDTLYLSANKFFQLAGVGTNATLQISTVGSLDVGSMTGTYAGLRVVGSYGFATNTAVIGDGSALLIAETPGAPVEMRAVEPSIGGMEVGIIGAFKAKVFDSTRFVHIA